MRTILLFSLMLNLLSLSSTNAQSTSATQSSSAVAITTTATTFVSLTPAMSSSSVASYFSSLATSAPQQPGSGPSAGDAGSASGSGSADSDAGASGGGSSGTIELSRGGLIAIIVVIVVVVVFGIASSILYWQAKKRSWEVRKTIRRSAKRVATALTPRRTTFPKDVRSSRGLTRIDEVPPTPRKSSLADIEKGNSKMNSFEMKEPPKHSKWGRKLGR